MSDITVINDSEQSSLVTNGLAKNGELYLKAAGSTDAGAIVVYDSGSWRTFANEVSAFSNTNSVDLDGSNDYIDCGGNTDFSFTDGSGNDSAFSISAWVKLDSNAKVRVAAKGNMEWLFGTDSSSRFNIILWSNSSTGAYLQRYSTSLSTNVWHNIAVTYDGSNLASGIKLYKAGNEVSSTDGSLGTYAGMAFEQGSLRIGSWEFNNSVMNGLVDEVAVFDYELNASQVSDIYNSGVPTNISSLSPIGWWRMGDDNGATGTTITDQGSGGNNGTLTNGPTFSTDIPS